MANLGECTQFYFKFSIDVIVQARSQVWVWGGVLFGRKWTFKRAFGKKWTFWRALLEVVDIFA